MKHICVNCLILSEDKKHEDLILDGWTWINAMHPTASIQMVCPTCTKKFQSARKDQDMGYYGGEAPAAVTGATTKLGLPDESELFTMRVHFHTPTDEDTYDEYDVTEAVYLQVAENVTKGMGIMFQYFVAESDPREPAWFACGPNVIKYID